MTVALLSMWGGQPPGTLYTSDAGTEAAMVAAKVATATLAGAVVWVPPGNSPGVVARVNGAVIARGNPNVTVTDTVGATATQMDFATITGGTMGVRSKVLVFAQFDVLGGTAATKNLILRAGPAAGSFATATGFTGQSGIPVGTRSHPTSGLIWNDGTLAAQRCTATNTVGFTGANGTLNTGTMAIDTSVDWNIYFGCNFSAAEAGVGSVILRNWYVQLLD